MKQTSSSFKQQPNPACPNKKQNHLKTACSNLVRPSLDLPNMMHLLLDWRVCRRPFARSLPTGVPEKGGPGFFFLCPSTLPFGGSTVLNLTRGPAGNRTTTAVCQRHKSAAVPTEPRGRLRKEGMGSVASQFGTRNRPPSPLPVSWQFGCCCPMSRKRVWVLDFAISAAAPGDSSPSEQTYGSGRWRLCDTRRPTSKQPKHFKSKESNSSHWVAECTGVWKRSDLSQTTQV